MGANYIHTSQFGFIPVPGRDFVTNTQKMNAVGMYIG